LRRMATPTSSKVAIVNMNGYACSPIQPLVVAYPIAVPALCTRSRREKMKRPSGYLAFVEIAVFAYA